MNLFEITKIIDRLAFNVFSEIQAEKIQSRKRRSARYDYELVLDDIGKWLKGDNCYSEVYDKIKNDDEIFINNLDVEDLTQEVIYQLENMLEKELKKLEKEDDEE